MVSITNSPAYKELSTAREQSWLEKAYHRKGGTVLATLAVLTLVPVIQHIYKAATANSFATDVKKLKSLNDRASAFTSVTINGTKLTATLGPKEIRQAAQIAQQIDALNKSLAGRVSVITDSKSGKEAAPYVAAARQLLEDTAKGASEPVLGLVREKRIEKVYNTHGLKFDTKANKEESERLADMGLYDSKAEAEKQLHLYIGEQLRANAKALDDKKTELLSGEHFKSVYAQREAELIAEHDAKTKALKGLEDAHTKADEAVKAAEKTRADLQGKLPAGVDVMTLITQIFTTGDAKADHTQSVNDFAAKFSANVEQIKQFAKAHQEVLNLVEKRKEAYDEMQKARNELVEVHKYAGTKDKDYKDVATHIWNKSGPGSFESKVGDDLRAHEALLTKIAGTKATTPLLPETEKAFARVARQDAVNAIASAIAHGSLGSPIGVDLMNRIDQADRWSVLARIMGVSTVEEAKARTQANAATDEQHFIRFAMVLQAE